MNKYKIMIVDDHPIVCVGMSSLLNSESHLEVIYIAKSSMEALEILDSRSSGLPDLIITDISIEGPIDGIQLTKKIRSLFPDLPILVLSIYNEYHYAERALRSGANGYIMKAEATENLINAINEVLNGKVFLSKNMTDKVLRQFLANPNTDSSDKINSVLTDREIEIFRLIGEGKTISEISLLLDISIKTINTHTTNIKKKLSVQNSNEFLKMSIDWVNSSIQ